MKTRTTLLTIVAILGLTAVTMAQNVPNYIPTNGLVGWWPFNGNANDESGNGNNGIVYPNTTLTDDRFSNSNSAYLFDNSVQSGIQTNNPLTYTNTGISGSLWFNTNVFLNASAGHRQFISGTNGIPFQFAYNNGGVDLEVYNQSGGLTVFTWPSIFIPNSWHHVAFSVNTNGSVLISIDGQVYNLGSSPNSLRTANNSTYIFGLSSSAFWPNPFSGKLDDIAIYNRALTQQEITALYTGATTCVPPVATVTPASSTTFCSGGSVVLNANSDASFSYQWQLNGANITGATNAGYTANASGNYSVIISNATNCADTSATTAVTVNALPTASITAATATTFCTGGSVVLNANTGTGLNYQWKNNGNNISGATSASYTASTTGSYTAVVTNGNGCSATSTATAVTVNPPPTATITASGATTFCQGGSVVLNANSGASLTYQWRNNGNNISGAENASYTANASGSYTVVVTNNNGCSASSTSTTVTVNPTPTVSISGLSNFTNYNANPVSVNGNPSGGSFTGAGISGTSFNPQTAGLGSATITYSFTNVNGCSNTATQNTVVYDTLGVVCTSYDTITTNVFDTAFVTLTVYDTIQVTVYDTLLTTVTDTLIINSVITGINPPNNLNTLKVFPNPANTHITINYGNFSSMSGYTLTIVNSIGQTVFTTPINQQSSYIDLSTWSGNGIYFVQLIDPQNNTIENRKIVIL